MRISDWSSDVYSSDLSHLDTYKSTNAALAVVRKRIERLFVQKAALQKRTLAEQRRMSRRVDDLARQAGDLRDLFPRLAAARPAPPHPAPRDRARAAPHAHLSPAPAPSTTPGFQRPFPPEGPITMTAPGRHAHPFCAVNGDRRT